MERDNRDPPARLYNFKRLRERMLDILKLIINRDTERLERPRGGMDTADPGNLFYALKYFSKGREYGLDKIFCFY